MWKFLRRLRYWFQQRENDAELSEELAFHLACRETRLQESGLSAVAAAHTARRELGNIRRAREDARAVWVWPSAEAVWQDARQAARSVRRQPGLAAVAVGTLSLAIGFNISVVSVFDAMFWRQWPVPEPSRLVQILRVDEAGRVHSGFTAQEFRTLAIRSPSFKDLVAMGCGADGRIEHCRSILDGHDVRTEYVSNNYFRALGVEMALGLGFPIGEKRVDTPDAVTVLSYLAWQQRFGADPRIIGRRVSLDDVPFTVVGVAPAAFTGTSLLRRDLWIPLSSVGLLRPQTGPVRELKLVGRLADEAEYEQARADIDMVSREFDTDGTRPSAFVLRPTSFNPDPHERQASVAFIGVVYVGAMLVLVITCANVANLLLVRVAVRGHEIALRTSLGASSARLIRQLMTESLVQACCATAVGVGIAYVAPSYILNRAFLMSNAAGPLALPITPDAWVLLYSAGVAIAVCVACGLLPALYATRADLGKAFADEVTVRRRRMSLRTLLLTVQIAASVILLVCAGLLVRGVQHARTQSFGFAVNEVAALSFELPASYEMSRRQMFAQALMRNVQAQLGSTAWTFTTATPIMDPGGASVRVSADGARSHVVRSVRVSSGYFDVLHVPLTAGRTFRPSDAGGPAVLINESAARLLFPGASAVGRALTTVANTQLGVREIVGVVKNADTEADRLRNSAVRPRMYELLLPEAAGNPMPRVLVGIADRGSISAVVAVASRLDGRVQVHVTPLSSSLDRTLWESHLAANLAGIVASAALAFACIGVFCAFSHVVQQRTQEIAIRMMLGASAARGMVAILRPHARALLFGLAIGLGIAAAGSMRLAGSLYGLSPFDPAAYVAAIAALLLAVVVALCMPARRAAMVDPVLALRAE